MFQEHRNGRKAPPGYEEVEEAPHIARRGEALSRRLELRGVARPEAEPTQLLLVNLPAGGSQHIQLHLEAVGLPR
jgi:hypothetical protein